MSHPLDCSCGQRAIFHIGTNTAYCPHCERRWNPTAELIDLGRPDDFSPEGIARFAAEAAQRLEAVLERREAPEWPPATERERHTNTERHDT